MQLSLSGMPALAQTGVKRIQQFSADGDPPLIRWHKTLLNAVMRRFGCGSYGLLWISFIKGALLMGLLMMLLR